MATITTNKPDTGTTAEFSRSLSAFIPFRDSEGSRTCTRRIRKQEITRHPNDEFHIRVIEDAHQFYFEFALDIVRRIREALEAGRRFVGIFPVGPMPQYAMAAELINELRVPCHHVTTFNMDEYADDDGNTAPANWPGSFQRAMMENFFLRSRPNCARL